MGYILMIWTLVGLSSGQTSAVAVYDWRPIGVFETNSGSDAQARCQDAARQLGLRTDKFYCIRSK